MVPLLGALLIAISRSEDYRHDVEDVCVGSAIGFAVAYWNYRRYWRALGSVNCDEPLPGRADDDSSAQQQQQQRGWQRVRDEEEGGALDGDDDRDVGYLMQSFPSRS